MNSFQNKLNYEKQKRKLTGAEFAVLIETKIDTYRKWSQDRATPSQEIQDNVLKILKETIE